MIDWSQFTPISSFIGGTLIGLAAALLILLNCRIAGVSCILGGVIAHKKDDLLWQLLFITGLIISPLIFGLFSPFPQVFSSNNLWLLVISGLLVGLGTRYGSGCTSGHGVCGLARLSQRSLVATLTFTLAGIFTVYVTHHVVGNAL